MTKEDINRAYIIARANYKTGMSESLINAGYNKEFANDLEKNIKLELGMYVWNKWLGDGEIYKQNLQSLRTTIQNIF